MQGGEQMNRVLGFLSLVCLLVLAACSQTAPQAMPPTLTPFPTPLPAKINVLSPTEKQHINLNSYPHTTKPTSLLIEIEVTGDRTNWTNFRYVTVGLFSDGNYILGPNMLTHDQSVGPRNYVEIALSENPTEETKGQFLWVMPWPIDMRQGEYSLRFYPGLFPNSNPGNFVMTKPAKEVHFVVA